MIQALNNVVTAQLENIQGLRSNYIKAEYGDQLYNFLIIDPGMFPDDAKTHQFLTSA